MTDDGTVNRRVYCYKQAVLSKKVYGEGNPGLSRWWCEGGRLGIEGWIPAFAGMTKKDAGMTEKDAGTMEKMRNDGKDKDQEWQKY